MRFTFPVMICAALVVLASAYATAQTFYDVTDLGLDIAPVVMNDTGDIAVQLFPGTLEQHAGLYHDGVVTDLGTLGGTASYVYGMNDSGYIVGISDLAGGLQHAFAYAHGVMTDLGTLPGGIESNATGINNLNVIIGWTKYVDTNGIESKSSFRYQDGVMTDIGNIGASTINDSGLIGGTISLSEFVLHTILYRNGTVTDLGTLGGNRSYPVGINREGLIAGSSEVLGTADWHAFIVRHDTMFNITTGFAGGINDSGVVVGSTPTFAFRYRNGTLTDLNTLINPDSGWHLDGAVNVNNHGEIIGYGTHNGVPNSVFLLTPGTLTVTRPRANEVVFVNQPDTIRWVGTQKNGWEVRYSLDLGGNFVTLDTILAPEVRELVWFPPDSLRSSSRCIIQVADATDINYLAESAQFKLRSFDLVRIDPDNSYSPFSPFIDNWAFNNDPGSQIVWTEPWWSQFDYQGGTDPITGRPYSAIKPFTVKPASTYPSWPIFVGAFGKAACYHLTFPSNQFFTYQQNAIDTWGLLGPYDGTCYGFSVSSLLIFAHQSAVRLQFPGLPPVVFLEDLPLDATVREILGQYFLYQFGTQQLDRARDEKVKGPKNVVDQLRAAFMNEFAEDQSVLNMRNPSGKGGHSVLPYHLRSAPESKDKVRIYVYDSNDPFGDKDYIEVDTVQNTWKERLGLGYDVGTRSLWLDLPLGEFLNHPVLGELAPLGSSPLSSRQHAASSLRIYNSPQANTMIYSAVAGSIGYVDGIVVDSMDNGVPIVPLTGTQQPPIGYYLPDDGYHVTMSNFSSPSTTFAVHSPGTILSLGREDATPSQTDFITVGDGLGLSTNDGESKSFDARLSVRQDSSELACMVHGLVLTQNDSLHIADGGGGRTSLFLESATAKSVDLMLHRFSAEGLRSFTYHSLSLPAHAVTHIRPQDDSLAAVVVLTDSGADGSVEDSVILSNETSGVREFYHPSMPTAFRLLQNFPNPFNPVTEIRFDVPVSGPVRLTVYDLLGRRISELLGESKEPGEYTVTWNASALPSGVYYYRLTAGAFSEMKKMLLMK